MWGQAWYVDGLTQRNAEAWGFRNYGATVTPAGRLVARPTAPGDGRANMTTVLNGLRADNVASAPIIHYLRVSWDPALDGSRTNIKRAWVGPEATLNATSDYQGGSAKRGDIDYPVPAAFPPP